MIIVSLKEFIHNEKIRSKSTMISCAIMTISSRGACLSQTEKGYRWALNNCNNPDDRAIFRAHRFQIGAINFTGNLELNLTVTEAACMIPTQGFQWYQGHVSNSTSGLSASAERCGQNELLSTWACRICQCN